VAAFVGVHPVHLARVFERWFGCAPGEYLRGRRLERAASLVGRGASALAETAIEAGFTDQAHLTRAFRDRFATTPAAWRRHVACVQAGRACLG
jgi:AraC family transcriptional regulator